MDRGTNYQDPTKNRNISQQTRTRGEGVEAGWRRFSRQTRTGKRRHNDIANRQTVPRMARATKGTEKIIERTAHSHGRSCKTKDTCWKILVRSLPQRADWKLPRPLVLRRSL